MRFLLYSHDGVGLGHTSRNIAIARALVKRVAGASVLLATGADYIDGMNVPDEVDVLKLPGLRKLTNGGYGSRRLAISEAEIRVLRSRLLESVVETFRPTVILADKHPFGVNGELRRALAKHQESGGRCALGLRDILDDKETVLKEWAPYRLQELVAHFFDRVLVYGQPDVLDPITEYCFPEELRERTRFCGYVVHEHRHEASELDRSESRIRTAPTDAKPVVLATVGGGEDGTLLLQRFLQASCGAPWKSIVVSGPLALGPDIARLRKLAVSIGAVWHTFLPDLPAWFDRVDTLVCMGGYNTLAEALARGTPVVCLPRSRPRREQAIRAEAFQRLGLISMVTSEDNPELMRSAILNSIHAFWRRRRTATDKLRFDGATVAAEELSRLAVCETESQAMLNSAGFALWML